MIKCKTGYVDKKLTYFRRSGESLIKPISKELLDENDEKLNKLQRKLIIQSPMSIGKVKYQLRCLCKKILKLITFGVIR